MLNTVTSSVNPHNVNSLQRMNYSFRLLGFFCLFIFWGYREWFILLLFFLFFGFVSNRYGRPGKKCVVVSVELESQKIISIYFLGKQVGKKGNSRKKLGQKSTARLLSQICSILRSTEMDVLGNFSDGAVTRITIWRYHYFCSINYHF